MRRYLYLPALAALIAATAWGQASAPADTSLGALARAARAQAAHETRPARVFTNDNLPHAGDLSVVGSSAANAEAAATAKPDKSAASAEEQQWRERFAAARTKLADDSRDLDLTQRELNLAQMQFYSNPNQALHQQYSRSDINRLTARVKELQGDITADQAALDALGEQLREAGLPPEWARP